jgi:hypothetical protein
MKFLIIVPFLAMACASRRELASKKVVEIRSEGKSICQNSKGVEVYDLTVTAYNEAEKGVPLKDAAGWIRAQAAFYDLFSYYLLPYFLLNTDISSLPPRDWRGGSWSKSWMQIDHIVRSETATKNSHGIDIQSIGLKMIVLGTQGNQLMICPDHSCIGLKSPVSGDEIIEIADKDGYESEALGTKDTKYLYLGGKDIINHYNDPSEGYFLFDLVSRSDIRIGGKFKNSYFTVPGMDQANICKEMKDWNLGYPKGCLETGWKTNEDFREWNSDRKQSETFMKTYLGKSGTAQCCDKDMNCNTYLDFACYPHEGLRMEYVDSVVRDYILKKSFSVEKKNSGKWSIYKIKFDPTIMCKYARDINELKNN